MVEPCMIMFGRGLRWFLEKSISANLLGSNLELWSRDHSNPPPGFVSMLDSIRCVVMKSFAIVMNAVSSTNASVSSLMASLPLLGVATSTRSEL
jgi:hypothetical protein